MKLKHLLACMAFISTGLMASVSYAGGNVTGISAPASAAQGTPVSVTITGSGFCDDGYTINWGDTHSNVVSSQINLPYSVPPHTYTSTGTYTISVAEHPGCTGGTVSTTINITERIIIGIPIPFSKIRSISGRDTARWGRSYRMKVLGDGTCKLRIDWGDGGPNYNANNYNLSAPRYLYHKFSSPGTKTIRVTPASTRFISLCKGFASKSVRVSIFRTAPKPAIKKAPGVRYQMK